VRRNSNRLKSFFVIFASMLLAVTVCSLFYYFKIKQNENYQNQLHFRALENINTSFNNGISQFKNYSVQDNNKYNDSEAIKNVNEFIDSVIDLANKHYDQLERKQSEVDQNQVQLGILLRKLQSQEKLAIDVEKKIDTQRTNLEKAKALLVQKVDSTELKSVDYLSEIDDVYDLLFPRAKAFKGVDSAAYANFEKECAQSSEDCAWLNSIYDELVGLLEGDIFELRDEAAVKRKVSKQIGAINTNLQKGRKNNKELPSSLLSFSSIYKKVKEQVDHQSILIKYYDALLKITLKNHTNLLSRLCTIESQRVNDLFIQFPEVLNDLRGHLSSNCKNLGFDYEVVLQSKIATENIIIKSKSSAKSANTSSTSNLLQSLIDEVNQHERYIINFKNQAVQRGTYSLQKIKIFDIIREYYLVNLDVIGKKIEGLVRIDSSLVKLEEDSEKIKSQIVSMEQEIEKLTPTASAGNRHFYTKKEDIEKDLNAIKSDKASLIKKWGTQLDGDISLYEQKVRPYARNNHREFGDSDSNGATIRRNIACLKLLKTQYANCLSKISSVSLSKIKVTESNALKRLKKLNNTASSAKDIVKNQLTLNKTNQHAITNTSRGTLAAPIEDFFGQFNERYPLVLLVDESGQRIADFANHKINASLAGLSFIQI